MKLTYSPLFSERVNLDKKEAISVMKLGEAIYEYVGSRLLDRLCKRKWRSFRKVLEGMRYVGRLSSYLLSCLNTIFARFCSIPYSQGVQSKLGHLKSLPDEVISMIFSHIDDIDTAFCFGRTNTRLFLISEKRMHELMGTPDWTGDRIMCVGESTYDDDIPEGVDLGEEYDHFLDVVYPACGNDDVSPNVYGWAEYEFTLPNSDEFIGSTGRKKEILGDCSRRFDDIGLVLGNKINKPDPVPDVGSTVLWNLSKNVYFDTEGLSKKLPVFHSPEIFDEDEIIGQALLYQICWSSSKGTNIDYGHREGEYNLSRGKWAGDRFELTGASTLEQRLKEEEGKWKNVSDEVIRLCLDVLKADGQYE